MNECLSAVSTTPAISCSAVHPWHGFSLIAWVVDTGDKFIAGDSDTSEQLSPVTPVNNYRQWQQHRALNLLPLTRTRMPWKWGAAKDRRKLKGTNWRYLQLSIAGDSFAKRTVLSRQYSLSPEEKIYRQCRLHRRAVYRRCHWHLWTIYRRCIFPGVIDTSQK